MSGRQGEESVAARVLVVPCLADNYAYLLVGAGGRCVVVDPSEAIPIVRVLEAEGLTLGGALCTHHHWDHVGGLPELRERYPRLRVLAHRTDAAKIAGVTEVVEDGDRVPIEGLEFAAMHVPGHTLGAVAWIGAGAVFTGDTLFLGGCGRLFEGTASMMHASLERIAALPAETRVYCGHEYTVANLRFAAAMEPNNVDVATKIAWARSERDAHRPTVPSTIADERRTNPFLRCAEPTLRARFPEPNAADVFARLRAAKDSFR